MLQIITINLGVSPRSLYGIKYIKKLLLLMLLCWLLLLLVCRADKFTDYATPSHITPGYVHHKC